MSDIQISLDRCHWDSKTKVLRTCSEWFAGGFPEKLKVFSPKTGKVVGFHIIPYGHPLYDEDQYDGEAQGYVMDDPSQGQVKVLYIIHEY